jgi:hypothetical protein
MSTHDEVKKEADPEGLPLSRQMKPHDEVQPTSPGVQVTNPTPITARPAAYQVGQSDPGQPAAPQIAVEATKPTRGNDVQEYRPSVSSRLPDVITAREVANDRSNADGCVSGEVQR